MKKFKTGIVALLTVAMAMSCVACGKTSDKASESGYADTVNVYMWSEYIPQEIFDGFEEEYGIHVNAAYYGSNDELIAKVTAGAGAEYDLIQPSVQKIPILVNGDYIEKLDFDKIPNISNLDENYQHMTGYEDYQDYFSVYMTDRSYIAYNEDTCPIEITSLNDLADPSLDNSLVITAGTGLITLGLNACGLDPYTTSEEDYEKAYEWAQEVYPNVKVIDGDSPKTEFMNGEVVAGQIYSGDLAILMDSMDSIKIAEVSEKMASTADVWAIPKGAEHKEEAELLINYILEPENLAKCLDAFPYGSPSQKATELTQDAYRNSPVNNLGDYYENGFYVSKYTGMEDLLSQLWTELSTQ